MGHDGSPKWVHPTPKLLTREAVRQDHTAPTVMCPTCTAERNRAKNPILENQANTLVNHRVNHLVNPSMVNHTLVNHIRVNHTLVNHTLVNHTLENGIITRKIWKRSIKSSKIWLVVTAIS